tara:strand:- start:2495 stop:2755 length:261 start_codon:yes stop_codon:yes gene_type:complete
MMEKLRPYFVGATLTAVLVFGMAQAKARGERWEYLYIEQQWIKYEPINPRAEGPNLVHCKLFNELGDEGWEIVQAGVGGFLFKRSR